MRFLRRGLTGLFILAVTLGFLAYGAILVRGAINDRMSREARAPQAQERVFSVNAQRVTGETLVPVITAYGEVQSLRTLEVRPAVSGTVVMMSENFIEGGRFAKGEVMLRIDEADAQSAFERAEADVMDAEAEARDAARALELARDELVNSEEQVALRERALVRQQDLKARRVGTDAAVETAEIAASTAKAAVLTRRQAMAQAEARVDSSATQLARARIALNEAERRLAETEITAQFEGVLSDVSAVEGRLVSTGERLAELVDAEALEVAFRISTQDYARLLDDSGQLKRAAILAVLSDFGIDLSAKGTLSRAGASNASGETGRVLFARLEAAKGFKPGDFVTVKISEEPMENVSLIAATALGAGDTVLAIGEDNRLELVSVELLRRQGDDVIIRAPALDGRLIVSKRTPLLGAGIRVTPVEAAAAVEAPAAPELIELTDERRAKLVAAIEANSRMPKDVQERMLAQLKEPKVPARMVERIESRMGG
ncbi:efflux RND transporter periplasmic adaptor subunit [Lentibacter sp. XHP0401]|uniref:efflux RND transporter periplasmic adaptor subunit n=1 Tax=Lentibacter sp. XHP0401 TaxID=2984334 RepID=UPI0021E84975|nr:HlyD family efflux transporter periplasmic adaptor subunit [Lentibacter sp. XHP0401]MCV2892919.1 HlyD family efflux transporter periplasmic adaptor subunit [Lentibacter sp. XHP0401]